MAIIKSYSDLQQSRKLAEILPLESADNVIVSFGSREGTKTVVMPKETLDVIRTPFDDIRKIIMCWSLAALLDVLPKKVEIADNVYLLSIYLTGLYYWNVNNGNLLLEVKDKDSLVDTCVEMILKLNELNLL